MRKLRGCGDTQESRDREGAGRPLLTRAALFAHANESAASDS
jgi:hypothetical protein